MPRRNVKTRVAVAYKPMDGDNCKAHCARVFAVGAGEPCGSAMKCRLDESTAYCLSNQVLMYRVVQTSGDVRKGTGLGM